MSDYTPAEMMTVAAARALTDDDVCFVGIGAPSAACNLARMTHAPGVTLIYESGTIGTKPAALPLSIGDGQLADTAVVNVSVPEMFRYWLQGGRISIGFLGAAQVDRFANLNTTVVGSYDRPTVRLPGGGGAPEIATSCGEVFLTATHTPRTFVDRLDFLTTFGHGEGGDHRQRLGLTTKGPSIIFTDLCILRPDPVTKELTVVTLHPGVAARDVEERTGWPIRFAGHVATTPEPTPGELGALRALHERTRRAHA